MLNKIDIKMIDGFGYGPNDEVNFDQIPLIDGNPISLKGKFTNQTITHSGGTLNVDLDNGRIISVLLEGNSDGLSLSGIQTVDQFSIILEQDSTGGRTFNWPSNFLWQHGVELSLSEDPNVKDVFQCFTVDGGNEWFVTLIGAEFS